jgi:adenosine deaminase
MGRELDFETNQKIAKKAIEYIGSGVVGIDIAGPGTPGFRMKDYSKVTNAVREKGGRVTIHTAEVEDADDIEDALLYLSPDRIGHGIRMALWTPDKKEQRRRNKVLEVLAALSIPLEICPLSNAATKAVVRTERNGKKYSRTEQFHDAFKRLDEFGVPYMIGTDWPAIIKGGDYASQMKWLLAKGILSPEQREKAICTGMDYSFIPGSGHKVYLGKP